METNEKTSVDEWRFGSVLMTFISLLCIPCFRHMEDTSALVRDGGDKEELGRLLFSLRLSEAGFILLLAGAVLILLIVGLIYITNGRKENMRRIKGCLVVTLILCVVAIAMMACSIVLNNSIWIAG